MSEPLSCTKMWLHELAVSHNRMLQMFTEYRCSGGVRVFGLQFNHLMDTLQVFASSGHELILKYPNANMQLECE